MILSNTDFVGEVLIPNNTNADVILYINQYIDEYEPEFMKKILGYALYKAYLADPLNAIYVKLIDGDEYTDEDTVLQQFRGLKFSLVRYVYWKIMASKVSQHTGTGTFISQSDQMTPVSPNKRMVTAWNQMAKNLWAFSDYMAVNELVYPLYEEPDRQSLYTLQNEFGI